jgi:hypothetical protein
MHARFTCRQTGARLLWAAASVTPWPNPLGDVIRESWRLLAGARREGLLLGIGLDALGGLPWALRRRQVVPPNRNAAQASRIGDIRFQRIAGFGLPAPVNSPVYWRP